MHTALVRLTSKGQMTIPQSVREALGLGAGDYLSIVINNEELRLKKVHPIKPLSNGDPILETSRSRGQWTARCCCQA